MIVFFKLLLAHLLGDFFIQPLSWVIEKEKLKARSPKLYYHVLIHGALIWLFIFEWSAWPAALFVAVTHFFIDWAKLSLQDRRGQALWFILDQMAHIAMLGLATTWWLDLSGPEWFSWMSESTFIMITGGLFLTRPMAIIMMVILKPWSRSLPNTNEQSLQSAGAFIGILERLLVYVFLLAGRWEAIGFLIAAKSVFRFSDIRDSGKRKLTEYILIGTLLSFISAILTGLLIRSLL